jgi:amino acid adenylation domain-containing protein
MTDISLSLGNLSAQEKRELLARMLRRKAREASAIHPMSYGQKALWFLQQSAPESAAYHIAFPARIRSRIDVPALRRAFQALVNRHPALRTTFRLEESEPVQVIHNHQEAFFETADASAWTWEELSAQVAAAYRRPFDLEQGPVLRANLFTTAADDHVLLLTIHHIAHDAWSLWVLQDELQALYTTELAGTPTSLTPLRHSYADHVQRQMQMLEGPEGKQLEAYWRKQLAGALTVLDLPADHPRPATQTWRGGSFAFKLDAALSRRVKELARAEGVTPFVMLLAVFQILLYRYTGQNDILVGSPTACRTNPEFAGTVGYFVNPVVMRARFSENLSFRTFLSQTRQTALDAITHQDYPFMLLVKRLQPKRDASYSPLFQVSFVLQKAQRAGEVSEWTPGDTETRMKWGGLDVQIFDLPQQEGQFDLELEMLEASGAFHGAFKYNVDLYNEDRMARMATHFSALLEGIVANPACPIEKMPLLTEAERRQVLVEWNDTQIDYQSDLCLHALCEAQARKTPDAVAARFEDQSLTYRELNARANQLAHHLRGLGVGPDVLVGICAERSLELVVGLLGILKAGGAYVPLDPGYPQERLAYMLEDSGVSVLLTQEKLANSHPFKESLANKLRIIRLDADWETLARESDANPESNVKPENLAYMIYTSGSMGKPKGAMNTNRGVCNRLLWMQSEYKLTADDNVLQKTPFSFDVSVWEFFWPLMTGARLVLAKPGGHRDNAYLADLIAKKKITTLHFVPSMLQLFVEEPGIEEKCGSLKRVICSGEALPYELQQRFFAKLNAGLHNLYGPTEAAIDVTYWECRRDDQRQLVPIGRPIANTRMYVLDRHLQPAPIGIPGELHIGGVNVGRGYRNRVELTAEKFIPDPFSANPNARLYKTGDLARFLADGGIEYLGRIDNQVKIRGFRIELDELGAVLDQHPKVRESVVVVREDSSGDKRLAAYAAPARGQTITADELRGYLKTKLPEFMVPAFFTMMDALPLSPNGKVDRRALPAPTFARETVDDFAAPRDEIERRLAQIWEDALDVHPIGVRDNFFDLGGDSLMAVRLMAMIGQAFGKTLSLAALFQRPTIEQLAEHLRQEVDPAPWTPLVEIQSGGSSTPLFFVPGGGGNVLYFYALARRLGPEQPFYGLQSMGLDGESEPCNRVEDMAWRYIEAIRTVQPQGPYLLGGHCFGGIVAFEMAQQLERQGQEVALLAILDAPAPIAGNVPAMAGLDNAAWLAKIAGSIEEVSGKSLNVTYEALQPLDPEAQLNYFKERLQHVGFLPPGAGINQVRGLVDVSKANLRAMGKYATHDVRPTPIALFRASETHSDFNYGADETSSLGWDRHAKGPVKIDAVSGNHLTMLVDPHAEKLAERLSARIREAARRNTFNSLATTCEREASMAS